MKNKYCISTLRILASILLIFAIFWYIMRIPVDCTTNSFGNGYCVLNDIEGRYKVIRKDYLGNKFPLSLFYTNRVVPIYLYDMKLRKVIKKGEVNLLDVTLDIEETNNKIIMYYRASDFVPNLRKPWVVTDYKK